MLVAQLIKSNRKQCGENLTAMLRRKKQSAKNSAFSRIFRELAFSLAKPNYKRPREAIFSFPG